MRKQYHFRPSPGGFYAWDVHRLVELSAEIPITHVPLEDIAELDENYWFQGAHEPTCREILTHLRLVMETDLQYPIILCRQGRVMDGMHRVLKAALEQRRYINAVRFVLDPDPDFVDVQPEELSYEE